MNNNYKTLEELKEELKDKFDEFMYKSNIELLTKIDKAIEYLNEPNRDGFDFSRARLIQILESEDKDEIN